jgi:hypothetical protein
MDEEKIEIITGENNKSGKYRISTIVFILSLLTSIIMFIFHKISYGIGFFIYAFFALFIPRMKINGKINSLGATIFTLIFLFIAILIICHFDFIFLFPWSWFY